MDKMSKKTVNKRCNQKIRCMSFWYLISGRCNSRFFVQAADASEAKTKDVGTLLPMEAEGFLFQMWSITYVC